MAKETVRQVAVKPVDAADLEARLAPVQDRIRQRAHALYCRRGEREGSALEDWLHAEREFNAAHLAGMDEGDGDIRITACVPDVNASDIGVDVLQNEIVVETDHAGKVERYERFRLPAKVEGAGVKARLRGTELNVVAPKVRQSPAKKKTR